MVKVLNGEEKVFKVDGVVFVIGFQMVDLLSKWVSIGFIDEKFVLMFENFCVMDIDIEGELFSQCMNFGCKQFYKFDSWIFY